MTITAAQRPAYQHMHDRSRIRGARPLSTGGHCTRDA